MQILLTLDPTGVQSLDIKHRNGKASLYMSLWKEKAKIKTQSVWANIVEGDPIKHKSRNAASAKIFVEEVEQRDEIV